MNARQRLVLSAAVIAFSATSYGCSSTSSCTRDPDTVTVADGRVIGNTYISAPNDAQQRGPWAFFPPARTLIFEHHLDGIPYQIAIWLAFQPVGTLAPSAGNLSIRQESDDATIAIKNDSCSEYWAWVEASLPVDPAAARAPSSGDSIEAMAGASGGP